MFIKTIMLSLLLILVSCMPALVPQEPQAEGNDDIPVMPILGVEVKVAYIHLNSLTLEEVSSDAVKAQVRDLWMEYDVVYMYIEAGEGLRYFDFGTVKIENGLPVRPWTTGDYHTTRKWNFLVSQEPVLEDNHAQDYSFPQYGFNHRFVRTPFAMHYRMRADWMARFNVLGANLDSDHFAEESQAVRDALDIMPATFWNTHGSIAFGNFTKNCQNPLGGLIIRNNDGTCAEQSVLISDYLKEKVNQVKVIAPEDNRYYLLTSRPMIEVKLGL
jgi:hypothetical protein